MKKKAKAEASVAESFASAREKPPALTSELIYPIVRVFPVRQRGMLRNFLQSLVLPLIPGLVHLPFWDRERREELMSISCVKEGKHKVLLPQGNGPACSHPAKDERPHCQHFPWGPRNVPGLRCASGRGFAADSSLDLESSAH